MKRNADPIDPAFAERMNVLAQFLDVELNGPIGGERQVGFVLLSFLFDDALDEGRTNYISNADLADVVTMLRTFLKHAEARLKADQRGKLQ